MRGTNVCARFKQTRMHRNLMEESCLIEPRAHTLCSGSNMKPYYCLSFKWKNQLASSRCFIKVLWRVLENFILDKDKDEG